MCSAPPIQPALYLARTISPQLHVAQAAHNAIWQAIAWVSTLTSGISSHIIDGIHFSDGALTMHLRSPLFGEIATRSRVPVTFELERVVRVAPVRRQMIIVSPDASSDPFIRPHRPSSVAYVGSRRSEGGDIEVGWCAALPDRRCK